MRPSFVARSAKTWPRLLSAYVMIHGLWLTLYALLGKGFAYAGVSPFYVGEMLLVFAILALCLSRRIASLAQTSLGILMIAFLLWQVVCTAPYIAEHGVDTLRDSVIWAYALFAWVTAAVILRIPGLLRTVVSRFGRFSQMFLILGPIAWLTTTYLRDSLPRWPDTTISVPLVKGDEYCVHLAGIFAFTLQGLGMSRQCWTFVILADAMLAMSVRSGLLAFIVACGVVLLLRLKVQRVILILSIGALLIAGMAALDLRFVVPGTEREFSLEQLGRSLQSVIGDSERNDLEATKQWRLAWWGRIWEYTIDGPYFWTGKGYGINLADSDGFQVGTRDEPLRSPHNSHLTFLARSGVPGFLLWMTLQLVWVTLMLRAFFSARRLGASDWIGVFAWLIAYWLAFLVAAGFDVFLEGPMAGIPFWTIFGLGWGSYTLFYSQIERGSQNVEFRQVRQVAYVLR